MAAESSINLQSVREFLARKNARRRAAVDERWELAQRDFARITRHIIAVYEPLRVYQWGSLLDRRRFSRISDIDIALEGLTGPEEYFAILGDAMNMTSLPLDIIELEKLDAETAELIRTGGKLVYERHEGTDG